MMAENQYTNKVVLSSGETLIDLTGDTADAAHVLKGGTFHDKSGAPVPPEDGTAGQVLATDGNGGNLVMGEDEKVYSGLLEED